MVAAEWAATNIGDTPIQCWQNKIRHLRYFLKGWAKNQSGKYRKEKERLLRIIDDLDIKSKTQPLSEVEKVELQKTHECVNKLRQDEETKWAQRAKVKHIQEGGNNTKYFHPIANGKHRKKRIFQLEQEEGTIVGEQNLRVYISEYYKKLFGQPENNDFSMNETEVDDITQLSAMENEVLTAGFTEEEVFYAISQMEHNKPPGPDGFPVEYYQHFWDTVKNDPMALFNQLHTRELPLFKLNFGIITLLPKKENAVQIEQYRPICLLNVSFNVFTKVASNRITKLAKKIIKPTQTACGDPAYHCMCSMQVVDITPMKHYLTSITSIKVVQQKHLKSKVGA
jgi:mannosylglycoprotein endo-beta-mannosidase